MKLFASTWWLGAAAVLALASCDSARNATDATTDATASTTVDPTPTPGDVAFSRNLTQGEYRFEIQSNSLDNGQQLTIKTRRGEALVSDPVRLNVRGAVTDAVMGDLNGNGNPELYIFTSGSGSGSYGGVEAYEFVNRAFRPLQAPQQLSGDMSVGYMGQDKYVVRGNRLVRTFPIYSGTEPGSTPTGGTRTIEYSLHPDGMLIPAGSSSTPGTTTTPGSTTTPGTTTPPGQ